MCDSGNLLVSVQVDHCFRQVLKDKFVDIVNSMVDGISHRFQPECDLLVDSVYYITSVVCNGTPGMQCFGIGINKSTTGKIKMMISTSVVLVSCWVFQRLKYVALLNDWRSLPESDPRRKIWEYLERVEVICQTLHITHIDGFFNFPRLLYCLMGWSNVQPLSIGSKEASSTSNLTVGLGGGISNSQLRMKMRQLLLFSISECCGTFAAVLVPHIQPYVLLVTETVNKWWSNEDILSGKEPFLISRPPEDTFACGICKANPIQNCYVSFAADDGTNCRCAQLYCYVCLHTYLSGLYNNAIVVSSDHMLFLRAHKHTPVDGVRTGSGGRQVPVTGTRENVQRRGISSHCPICSCNVSYYCAVIKL